MEDVVDDRDFGTSLTRLRHTIEYALEEGCYFSHSSGRGQPRLLIGEERLRFLFENGFKIDDIAKLCGCSSRKVDRCLKEAIYPLVVTRC